MKKHNLVDGVFYTLMNLHSEERKGRYMSYKKTGNELIELENKGYLRPYDEIIKGQHKGKRIWETAESMS